MADKAGKRPRKTKSGSILVIADNGPTNVTPEAEGPSCPARPLRDYLAEGEMKFIDFLVDEAIASLMEKKRG
jgi:hypothetical protein